jgi:RNA polymerase sigma factor (sigma-70 family)
MSFCPMMPAMSSAPQSSPSLKAPATEGDDDDRRLIGRVCHRELAAFEVLYRRYHPRISRFLHRMLRPTHLVDEVLDDTLMVVWNNAERYNGQSKVSTWIFAIAYRKALKALASHDEPVDSNPEDDPVPAEESTGPEARTSHAQLRAALDVAMKVLSVDQRAAVELTYFHGFSYPEIALVVDCPTDTVKTRMFHARRRLKAAFSGRLDDWL